MRSTTKDRLQLCGSGKAVKCPPRLQDITVSTRGLAVAPPPTWPPPEGTSNSCLDRLQPEPNPGMGALFAAWWRSLTGPGPSDLVPCMVQAKDDGSLEVWRSRDRRAVRFTSLEALSLRAALAVLHPPATAPEPGCPGPSSAISGSDSNA